MKAIIIDDEERGIDVLARLIDHYCPEINVVSTATDILTAATGIRQHRPDVVFLDIAMPGGNGFQLLELFDQIDFEIIFVTAYHEYAIKALRFAALDYLLKPVNINELQQACKRLQLKRGQKHILPIRQLRETLIQGAPLNKIVLSDMTGHYFVNIHDIIYCEADENYTHIYMTGDLKYTVSRPLKEYGELFERHHFFRIHKSFLINLGQVAFVNKDFQVIMNNRKELPLSFRKRTEFFNLLKDHHLM